MREVKDRNILDKFALEFAEVVERFTDYIIVSGFVAISSGRTRGTEDIDMIIPRVEFDLFAKMHEALGKKGFVCLQSDSPKRIFEYLTDNTSVRYAKEKKPLPEMELKFSKDGLDEYQIKTRVKLPLTGLPLWFSSINVNIAFKEELLKSQKDIDDAKHLRIVYSEITDEKEINNVKRMIKRYRL